MDEATQSARVDPRWPWLGLAVVEMAAIHWLSGRTWDDVAPDVPSHTGDLLHLALFGGLAFTLGLGFGAGSHRARRWPHLAAALAAAYGLLDEVHQFFVHGRSSSLVDVIVDAHGAVAAVLLLDAWLRRDRSRLARLFDGVLTLAFGVAWALCGADAAPQFDGALRALLG